MPYSTLPLERASKWTHWVRRPKEARIEAEGWQAYKKGYEVRFLVLDATDEKALRACLRELGFKAGRAYAKGSRRIVPLYGEAAVKVFGE